MKNEIVHIITESERYELQKCLFHMMVDIIDVCEQNNITYMLGGGSALGAVRHKGFIPWDDDLDLNMPRKDYNKFITIMERELGEYYEFSAPNTDCVEYSFLKVYKKGTRFTELFNKTEREGVWIDIFPIEYAPNNALVRRLKGLCLDAIHFLGASLFIYEKKNRMTKTAYNKTNKQKIRYCLAMILGKIFRNIHYEMIFNIFDKFAQTSKKTKIMTVPTGRNHYWRECLPVDVIYPPKKNDFCGKKVNVYQNVERYLSQLYGDYLIIPPVEKREKHYISDFYISKNIGWRVLLDSHEVKNK